MDLNKYKYVMLLVFVSILGAGSVSAATNLTATINGLFHKLQNMQTTKYNPAVPPLVWAKFPGVYESDVKMYFHGAPVDSTLRYAFGVFDNNMFATAWVTACLLEAYKYGKAPKPTTEMLDLSINFIMDHRNKNLNYTNSIMAFWPQIYNEKAKVSFFSTFLKPVDHHPNTKNEVRAPLNTIMESVNN